MKNLMCILLFIMFSVQALAQTLEQKVERDFLEYSRLTIDKKLDEALNYSNPKLFEIISREQMKNLLSAVYNTPDIEYSISMPKVSEFEPLKKIEGRNFIRFKSRATIMMKSHNILGDQTKTENVTRILQEKFGSTNVTYDNDSGFFTINTTKIVIAESDEEMENWKFAVIDNPKSKIFLEKILPKELLD